MPMKPKPARRPVSAAEWESRWRKLRRYIRVEQFAFARMSKQPGYHPMTRDGYASVSANLKFVCEEMSRLTRPTRR